MNPYYSNDVLGWKQLEIEYGSHSYEFDTLVFWRTETGEIFMAHDTGCSCPTPFDEYKGETGDKIKQKLERVGSLNQAKTKYKSLSGEDDKPNLPWSDVRSTLIKWGLK